MESNSVRPHSEAQTCDSDVALILEIGADLGSIELYGRSDGPRWQFCRLTSDQSMLLCGAHGWTDEVGWVDTWGEALALLDQYPWARLSVVRVDSRFRNAVWEAAAGRLCVRGEAIDSHAARQLARWREYCQPENN